MRSEAREQISALMDNELLPEEQAMLWHRIETDEEYRQVWESYQTAVQVMRGPLNGKAPSGFADQIMTALEEEPAIAVIPHQSPSAVSVRSNRKWAMGLAAGVAAVAFSVTYFGNQQNDSPTLEPVIAMSAARPNALPAKENVVPAADVMHVGVTTVPEVRFTRYLVDHNEYGGLTNIRGVMPYARIATSRTLYGE